MALLLPNNIEDGNFHFYFSHLAFSLTLFGWLRKSVLIMMSDTLLYFFGFGFYHFGLFTFRLFGEKETTIEREVIGERGYKFENFTMRIMLSFYMSTYFLSEDTKFPFLFC
jgi:hypothetical protein